MVKVEPMGIVDTRSSVIPMVMIEGRSDRLSYDREAIFNVIHEKTDRLGFLIPNQREIAADVDISYQLMNQYFDEFIKAGFMKKSGRNRALRKFRVVYHPDDCDWDAFYDFIYPDHLKGDNK